MEKSNISTIDAFSILIKWRKFIIANFLIFTFVATAVSLMIPKQYTCVSSLFPPEQQGAGGLDLMSFLGELPVTLPNLPGMTGPSDLYVAILHSRNVREAVAADNDLQRIYKKKTIQETLKALDKNTYIDQTEEDIIIINSPVGMPGRAIRNKFLKDLEI